MPSQLKRYYSYTNSRPYLKSVYEKQISKLLLIGVTLSTIDLVYFEFVVAQDTPINRHFFAGSKWSSSGAHKIDRLFSLTSSSSHLQSPPPNICSKSHPQAPSSIHISRTEVSNGTMPIYARMLQMIHAIALLILHFAFDRHIPLLLSSILK